MVAWDHQGKYILVSLFIWGGGYIGIIDTRTKGVFVLFCAMNYSYTGTGASLGDQSVHTALMSTGK